MNFGQFFRMLIIKKRAYYTLLLKIIMMVLPVIWITSLVGLLTCDAYGCEYLSLTLPVFPIGQLGAVLIPILLMTFLSDKDDKYP